MKNIAHALFMLLVISLPATSYAFKLDTHLWVGQQVINDLADDGQLSIKLGDQIVNVAVRPEIVSAILANQSDFLLGNLGPDVMPDVVVGQMAVHPGVIDSITGEKGWQTNDWLQHMLNNAPVSDVGTAVSYGYLGHAAADVFAHTYVNQYAGGVFSLLDGEVLVEERHYMLEGFIGKHTPPMIDHLGQPLGVHWQQVILDDDYARFVRDTLIFNDDAQTQYAKMPDTTHMAAFYQLKKDVDSEANAEKWQEIDIFVVQQIAEYYDVYLTEDQANQVVTVSEDIIKVLNGDNVDNLQTLSNNIYEAVSDADAQIFSNLQAAVTTMKNAEEKVLLTYQNWRDAYEDALLAPLCTGGNWKCIGKKIRDPITGKKVCIGAWVWVPDTRHICTVAQALADDRDNFEQELLSYKNDMIQATLDVKTQVDTIVNTIQVIKTAAIDLAQLPIQELNPVQSVLLSWSNDIDNAMLEYVKATSQGMINTINPDPAATLHDPIIEWFECYGTQLAGIIPSAANFCGVRNSLLETKEALNNIIAIIDSVSLLGGVLGIPSKAELQQMVDDRIDVWVNAAKLELEKTIIEALPPEVQDVLYLLDNDFEDDDLNYFFNKPETINPPRGLFMIENMASRVKAEMKLITDNTVVPAVTTFDPEKYAPAYNAVVLAKLALLDGDGYRQLATAAGSSSYELYNPENIVAQAFSNIDGNHQWMPLPPPLHNRVNDYSADVTETFSTDVSLLPGAGGFSVGDGFLLWRDDMRDTMFRKLFIGPLSSGIDVPSILNMPALELRDYPYKPCVEYPFPWYLNNQVDNTCEELNPLVLIDGIDVAMTALSTPTSAVTGGRMSVSSTVANLGNVHTVGGVTINYFISTDTVFDANDMRIAGVDMGRIYPGDSKISNFTIVMPTSIPVGTYYILVVADPLNTITEIDDPDNLNGNNLIVSPAIVVTIGADMAMTDITAPSNVVSGRQIEVSSTVTNIGSGTGSAYVYVEYFISSDTVFDASDVSIASINNRSICAGCSKSSTYWPVVPANLANGTYYLMAVADPDNLVIELDDPNNLNGNNLIMMPINISEPIADISMTSIKMPTSLDLDIWFNVSITATNIGTLDSDTIQLHYYLSTDTTYDKNDLLLSNLKMPGLAAGQSGTATYAIYIPSTSIRAGSYYLLAIADIVNAIPEADDPDNLNGNNKIVSPWLAVGNILAK